MSKHDAVNHPSYYTDGKYECIDFIESWGLGFHLGNAVKYISRAGKKYPETRKEDLQKALWYVKRARSCVNPASLYPSPLIGYGIGDLYPSPLKPIDVYDYASDKQLSYPVANALLYIVRGDLDSALIHLDVAIKS